MHVNVEPLDDVERVEGREARYVEELGEDQDREHQKCARHTPRGELDPADDGPLRCRRRKRQAVAIPPADIEQEDHAEERDHREPRQARLAEGHHDQRRQQRPQRRTDIASDLKQGLSESIPAARGKPCDAGRFRMEDGRAQADHRGAEHEHGVGRGPCKHQEPAKGRAHADGQRERERTAVRIKPHHRLEQRGGDIEGERDDADLGEIEREGILQHRVDRRQQRLDHVVEEMGEADRGKRGDGSRLDAMRGQIWGIGGGGHGSDDLSVGMTDGGGKDAGL